MATAVQMPERNELRGAIEMMRRNMPELIEYARLQAEIRKSYYDSLLEAGFTAEQAVELCKAPILSNT